MESDSKRRLGLAGPMPDPDERRGSFGGFPGELSPHFINNQLGSTYQSLVPPPNEFTEPSSYTGEYGYSSQPRRRVPHAEHIE